VQEFAPHHFARAAFEENVVGDDDGRFAVHFENVPDVLNEVELFVAGGGPEIFADDVLRLALDFALIGDEGDAGLFAEGRIGQHHVEVFAGVGGETVGHVDGTVGQT